MEKPEKAKKASLKKKGAADDPAAAKLSALTSAMERIEKTYGRGAVMKLGDDNVENVEVIPTGSIGLNYALGVGGFPRGRITEIFGPESSGKTTLAIHAIAEAQKRGGIAAIIDAEHAFDRFYAEKLGDMGDRNVGLQARLMSQAMRKLTGTIARTNTTCIFINQLRDKIGGMSFGPSETTTGGNALKFYASVRVDIRPSSSIKAGEDIIGRHAKVKVVKNKVAPPFKRAEFDIMFGEGISKAGEIIDLGVEYDIIKKSGSWFSYDGSKLAQGRDAAKQVISDNPELAEELEAKIMEALKADSGNGKTAKPKLKLTGLSTEKEEEPDEELTDTDLDEGLFPDDEFSIEDDVRD